MLGTCFTCAVGKDCCWEEGEITFRIGEVTVFGAALSFSVFADGILYSPPLSVEISSSSCWNKCAIFCNCRSTRLSVELHPAKNSRLLLLARVFGRLLSSSRFVVT